MMPLADIFFLGIVLYLLYRFIFGFVVPVARTTKHVREQFRNMQDQADDHNFSGNNFSGQNPSGGPFRGNTNTAYTRPGEPQPKKPDANQARPKNTMGEYIDFEEIK